MKLFSIMPVRVLDYSDTNNPDNVEEMSRVAISIEKDDVEQYLKPFLERYFDCELEANNYRVDYAQDEETGEMKFVNVVGFQWYRANNFYTLGAVECILEDIRKTVDAIKAKASRAEPALITEFYESFIIKMENMIKAAEEEGFDLISFEGP